MYLTDKSTLDNIALKHQDQKAAAQAGTFKPSNVTNWNPLAGWTAGSAISTAEDMALYTKKLVVGGLLDAKTQQLRLDNIRPDRPKQTPREAATDRAFRGLPPTSSVTTVRSRGT